MRHHKKTKNELLQELVEEWRVEHHASSINTAEVTAWLIRTGKWAPRPADVSRVIRKELQIALREQYMVDPQGRRVRQKHAQRMTRELMDGSLEQYVLWHDMREATRPQMQAAFQQRRLGIARDCRRLKIDADSYNENWNSSVPIQLVFDFTDDMADMDYEDPADSDDE